MSTNNRVSRYLSSLLRHQTTTQGHLIPGIIPDLVNDSELINPWGISIVNNQPWIVNNFTDAIINYDLFGNKLTNQLKTPDKF